MIKSTSNFYRFIRTLILSVILLFQAFSIFCQTKEDLSGEWSFRIDPYDQGLDEKWYSQNFPDQIHLPGSLQEQGYGNDVDENTVWYSGELDGIWRTSPIYEKYRKPGNIKIFEWLQPAKHYIGAAWYQRKIAVPSTWKEKHIVLFLERVHWSSTVWIDGHLIGSERSLAAPHEYDLSQYLSAGSKHTLTIRVNNAQIVDVGKIPHSVSDETQTAWNGIIGKIELQSFPLVRISDVQVYPDIDQQKAKVILSVKNDLNLSGDFVLRLQASSINTQKQTVLKPVLKKVRLKGSDTTCTMQYAIGKGVQLWSEFDPVLYRLAITLKGNSKGKTIDDSSAVTFGMREIGTQGTHFSLNGRIISLRGNVDCAIFPLHGYPRMDVAWWRNLWKTYKSWGLNAARFHSWCPPEAAFTAADEEGIYLQPEVDEWSRYTTAAQDSFFREESNRMLNFYGNHASFLMMALGNELRADSTLLYQLVETWKQKDNRRLYTGKIAGNPVLDNFQFYNTGIFKGEGLRYHAGPAPSWPPQPMSSAFNAYAPQTTLDFRKAVNEYNKPLVAHEIGQRCSYPDVNNEPENYTGLLKATYMDIARDQLDEHGMTDQVNVFVRASGAWQAALYKEEIEANLRTPGIGGFNLLDLQDFPGQSSAPVGLLNVFYQNKGAVTPDQFRRFCSPKVVLARMSKRVFENDERFTAAIELYNFADSLLHADSIICRVKDAKGNTVYEKKLKGKIFPVGNNLPVGDVSLDLGDLKAPARYTLAVNIPGTGIANDWNFWIFPKHTSPVDTSSILITHVFDKQVQQALNEGKTVLLLPDTASIRGGLPMCFTNFYWTAFDLHGGESSSAGLVCDPNHPIFKNSSAGQDGFPTSYHTDWQWWDLLTRARPMILDYFDDPAPFPKSYRPLVQMIDSWKLNRKLGVLMEGKVGKGKLMICSIDLEHDLDQRPATRQFRHSLLKYMTSVDFDPTVKLTPAMVQNLFYHYPDTAIVIDAKQTGFRFDGVGAISAGASSRLLYDYPKRERDQILDYLFKPGYGAAMQLLKIEIGGDMNATDGSEASHERDSGVINCDRGYEWWLINEAKKRNPNIKLIGLAWGAPGWVKNFWSKATISYIMDWLECAKSKGIAIDYVGGWNERGWNADWYIALDSALNKKFPHIKIIAADDFDDPWAIASEMVRNAALKQAVDVVGVHEACGWRTDYTKCASTSDARSLGKPMWNSEHSSLSHDVGAIPLARAMNRMYIQGKITGNMCWSLVSAWYSSLPIADTGPLLAEWPWSGYYEVGKSIWVYAHTAQFTQPGWYYLDSACGFLASGASYVTLQSPDKNDFTTIIEAIDAKAPQLVNFTTKGKYSDKVIHVWESNLKSDDPKDYFNRVRDVEPGTGLMQLELKPGYLYTISTTTGQHKGAAQPVSDKGQQMSLPFEEDFESYEKGRLARYFSDVNGAFEVAPCKGGRGGSCYRQMVTQQPVTWIDKGMPAVTVLGDPRWWGDYKVGVDILLEQKGYVELLGRVSAQKGLSVTGYHLRVSSEGEWQLYSEDFNKKDSTLLTGKVAFNINEWHHIALEMRGDQIGVVIDGHHAGTAKDGKYITGQIGLLVSPWQQAEFDNLSIDKTADWPRFVPKKDLHVIATSEHAANYRGYDYIAGNAVDDRPESFWHTEWTPKYKLPQSITIDLGKNFRVAGLVYQPRLDGNTNGHITDYTIYTSGDNIHFKKTASGKWQVGSGSKSVRWNSNSLCRYIRLEATQGVGAEAAAGEIGIVEKF